ncbi:MAG TPA: DUF2147 domain-containing protein [Methyloceanibacter sp.]|jgi:uncharacterized protein (DUF2147 family)|nr:DUF2147 domain-containing protein [Methyloceanibacter sp.]
MRHHAFAALGLLTAAAVLAPCSSSQAATADPTGYWYKPDAERESKIQVFKCGPGKKQLCAKIAWLKNPNDSKGRPLHDIRNENPSARDRPIVGLQIFTGLAPSAPGVWTGKIYNPEDGHTYTATLTVLSRKEIKLRGCKAWLLCGEKQWLRTSAPPPDVIEPTAPAEGTQQVEASAAPGTPAATPVKADGVAVAESAPAPSAEAAASAAPSDAAPLPQEGVQALAEPEVPTAPQAAEAAPKADALPVQEVAEPAAAPAGYDARSGYGFLNVSADPADTAELSGENVPSMITMTEPLATEQVAPPAAAPAPAATRSVQPVPAPEPKPKAKPKPIATAAVKPAPKPAPEAKPAAQPAPQAKPTEQNGSQQEATAEQTDPEAQDAAMADTAQAEAAMIEEPPLTRRQKRLLRRQQHQMEGGGLLPWLR